MNQNKNLFSYLSMWWEERKLNQPSSIQRSSLAEKWLPNRGNVLLSVITIMTVFGLNRAGALTLTTSAAAPTSSTHTIPYQGRIANASGQAITGTQPMIFRLYNVASGGTHLWEEQWTGPNSVRVSDGLFNVMLGSLNGISQAVITGNPNLWLGITVGSDNEMTPRVQLGSVPFATQALTVPDGSITAAKLADGAGEASRIYNWAQLAPYTIDNAGPGGVIVVNTGPSLVVPSGKAYYYLVTYKGVLLYNNSDKIGANTGFYAAWNASLLSNATQVSVKAPIVRAGYRLTWVSTGDGGWYWGTPYETTWYVRLEEGTHNLKVQVDGYSDNTMNKARLSEQQLQVLRVY